MSVAAVRRHSRRRAVAVGIVLSAVLLVAVVVALLAGEYRLSPVDVVRALGGDGSRLDVYIVAQVRLPRLVMALVCGAALGMAGALFQSLLRNPLASPDLLGISGGASVAAVWATLVLGVGGLAVAGLAVVGALVVAGVLLLAARRISDGGYRLVLAGVGISFLCAAIVGYLIKRARVESAADALQWITGSVGVSVWRDVVIVGVVVIFCIPGLVVAARTLPVLELGDPMARGLGTGPVAARAAIVSLAVVLAATTTAFIGPVAFVALCAPAIARSLIGRGSAAIAASGAVGAALVAAADLIGQYAIPGLAVPVGVVTGIVGAPYLLWLLGTSKGRRG